LQEVVLVPRKSRETPHLRIRLEPALLARLEKAREKTGRTLTGEIAKRLEQSFRRDDQQDLIAATVDQTLTAYGANLVANMKAAIMEARGLVSPPATPSYSGIVGPLTDPRRSAEQAPSESEKKQEKSK
jgi:hypothetical protein